MYQDRNNNRKLIKPFVALENTPLKDLKWLGLSEEDKIRLRKLYPKPWMDQEFRWNCPLTTIPDVPIGKLNGAVIPEECEVDFYTELYGDEARCYFDVLSKAEKSEKIFADASEQANAMIPVQNQMQGPAPISAWESGMVSGGRQNAFAANQFQAPVPVFTPMEGRVFSEKDCNDADTADNICRILDGSYIYVAEQKCYYQWNQRIWEKMPVLEFKKRIVAILQKRFVYVRTKETDVDMDYARKLCDNKKIDDIIQIINAKKRGDKENLFFSPNGVAGLVFYGFLVLTIVLYMTGHKTPGNIMMVIFLGIPVILFLLKEPLGQLVEGKKPKAEGGVGMFLVQGFFELFETMLSFFSNTISFVRIGAFAVSHAAMMEVVLMLGGITDGAGNPNWIIIVLGNIIVCGLEGLVVGIQVLRLEYYEMFSRFYTGSGREFHPYDNHAGKEN